MIPFFRKIRWRSAQDNQFFKYSRYAIGEIVLVVIGILIALQINNWNEERKQKIETKNLILKVRKELLQNIIRTDQVLNYYFFRDSLVYKVLKSNVTAEDYKNNQLYKELPWDFHLTLLTDEDFNNLLEKGNIFSKEQDSIITKLKKLYSREKKNIDNYDDYVQEIAREFKDKIKEDHSWFSDHRAELVTDEMIDFFLNDYYYLNAIHDVSKISYEIHLGYLASFRLKASILFEEISEFLEVQNDSIVSRNYNNFNHYLGQYIESKGGIFKVDITKNKENNLILTGFNNDSIFFKAKIYPYSKTHFLMQANYQWARPFQIVIDSKSKVKGLYIVGNYGRGDSERFFMEKIDSASFSLNQR